LTFKCLWKKFCIFLVASVSCSIGYTIPCDCRRVVGENVRKFPLNRSKEKKMCSNFPNEKSSYGENTFISDFRKSPYGTSNDNKEQFRVFICRMKSETRKCSIQIKQCSVIFDTSNRAVRTCGYSRLFRVRDDD